MKAKLTISHELVLFQRISWPTKSGGLISKSLEFGITIFPIFQYDSAV